MDLSILIVNYNTKKLLESCIASIVTSNPKITYELRIVDNNSTYDVENQIDSLKKQYPTIPLFCIYNKENKGYGFANNQAAKQAKGECLLFLNTDAEVKRNTIDTLYATVKNNQMTIAAPKLVNPNGSVQYSCGPQVSLPVVFIMLFLKGDKLGISRYSPSDQRQVDWVSGACFSIKRSDFFAINGFDENMFMYMEEIEFMHRFKKGGGKIFFIPQSICVHIGSASSENKTTPILNIYKGLVYFYKKHYGWYSNVFLRLMLVLKAYISYIIGILTNNNYLKRSYKQVLTYI